MHTLIQATIHLTSVSDYKKKARRKTNPFYIANHLSTILRSNDSMWRCYGALCIKFLTALTFECPFLTDASAYLARREFIYKAQMVEPLIDKKRTQ